MNRAIYALAVGTNGFLYAGGEFTTAAGVPSAYIAHWIAPPLRRRLPLIPHH